jgi:hypothetical protein
MDDRRFTTLAVPALLFVVTGVVAIALLSHGSSGPLGTTLAVGTLSSLVATMIVSAARVLGAVRPQPAPTGAELSGLLGATSKSAVTSEAWLQLLREAKAEFYIAGHSLGKWCSASNRDEFKSHIRRVLDSNGRVTLVMLDPSSPQIARLQRATSIDYTSRIQTSLHVLGNLSAELDPSAKTRLTISILKDHLTLPYMVVGNERRLMTATYLGSSDSDDVPCLELKLASEAATAVYDDFHRLADAGDTPRLPSVPIAASQAQPRRRRSWLRFPTQ